MIHRIAFIALGALLLAGCSGVQLAYRNADLLITSYVDDALDLADEQEDAWRPLLEDVLARHRESELPALVALLGELERGAAEGYTERGLACVRDEAWQRWRSGAVLLAEAAAPLLADLQPAQVERMRERFRERDEEFREEHLAADPEERHAARVARMVKRIEHWTGRLDGQQRALIESHVDTWPPLAQSWFDYHQAKRRQLLALLESAADAPRLQAFLADWWVRQVGLPPTLGASRDRVQADMLRMFVELQATLGREQGEQLVSEFEALHTPLAALVSDHQRAAAVVECGSEPSLAGA